MPDCSSQIINLEALSDGGVLRWWKEATATLVEIHGNQFAAELMQFDFIEHVYPSSTNASFCYVKNQGMNCLAYWRKDGIA